MIGRRALGLLAWPLVVAAFAACSPGDAGSRSSGGPPPTRPADFTAGKALFQSTCATCHGPNGEGVTNLGKDMRGNQWIAEQTDAELIAFLKIGRRARDPRNVTGIDMPPKGGNAALTDEDLAKIVQFLRTL